MVDLSTQIWLRQALCSQTPLMYEDVRKRPTTSCCKMKKGKEKKGLVKRQHCGVVLIYSVHPAASWRNGGEQWLHGVITTVWHLKLDHRINVAVPCWCWILIIIVDKGLIGFQQGIGPKTWKQVKIFVLPVPSSWNRWVFLNRVSVKCLKKVLWDRHLLSYNMRYVSK